MSPAEQLTPQVLALPENDRWKLAAALLASLPKPPGLPSEDDPGLDALLQERLDDHLSGRDKGIPADEFFRRLRAKRKPEA